MRRRRENAILAHILPRQTIIHTGPPAYFENNIQIHLPLYISSIAHIFWGENNNSYLDGSKCIFLLSKTSNPRFFQFIWKFLFSKMSNCFDIHHLDLPKVFAPQKPLLISQYLRRRSKLKSWLKTHFGKICTSKFLQAPSFSTWTGIGD